MDEITNRLKIPGWWFTAVVVSTLASLAAGYLKDAILAALAGISTRMKKYMDMTNSQIGQIFNGLTFSAVAKVSHRMTKAVEENRELRKRASNIIYTLS